MIAVAIVASALVVAHWAEPTQEALDTGMYYQDTTWYHMSFSGRFAQTGEVGPLHFTDPLKLTAWFYPQNSELLHAIPMVALDNDFALAADQPGLAGALAAGGVVHRAALRGRRRHRCSAPRSCWTPRCSSARRPATPPTTSWGSSSCSPLLAFLVNGAATARAAPQIAGAAGPPARPSGLRRPRTASPASTPTPTRSIPRREWSPRCPSAATRACSRGSARGRCSWPRSRRASASAPRSPCWPRSGVLTVGIAVLAGRGHWLRAMGIWLGGMVITSGFWYGRNLIHAVNPFPQIESIGPIDLPGPDQGGFYPREPHSLSEYSNDPGVWEDFFFPVLDDRLGPAVAADPRLGGGGPGRDPDLGPQLAAAGARDHRAARRRRLRVHAADRLGRPGPADRVRRQPALRRAPAGDRAGDHAAGARPAPPPLALGADRPLRAARAPGDVPPRLRRRLPDRPLAELEVRPPGRVAGAGDPAGRRARWARRRRPGRRQPRGPGRGRHRRAGARRRPRAHPAGAVPRRPLPGQRRPAARCRLPLDPAVDAAAEVRQEGDRRAHRGGRAGPPPSASTSSTATTSPTTSSTWARSCAAAPSGQIANCKHLRATINAGRLRLHRGHTRASGARPASRPRSTGSAGTRPPGRSSARGAPPGTSETSPGSSSSAASSTPRPAPPPSATSARPRPRSRPRSRPSSPRSSARSARIWTRTERWGGSGELRRVPGRFDRAARRARGARLRRRCACGRGCCRAGRAPRRGWPRSCWGWRCWSWCWSWSASSASTGPAGCWSPRSSPGLGVGLAVARPGARGIELPSPPVAPVALGIAVAAAPAGHRPLGDADPGRAGHRHVPAEHDLAQRPLRRPLRPGRPGRRPAHDRGAEADGVVLPAELRAAAFGGHPLPRHRLPLAADERRLDGALPAGGLELRAALRGRRRSRCWARR